LRDALSSHLIVCELFSGPAKTCPCGREQTACRRVDGYQQ
jgi:hypothetical protein